MKSKSLSLVVLILSVCTPLHAQETVPKDSLVYELQEIVVKSKQPATKLVGSTLVSTIAGSNLQNAGNALDVLQQLPMLSGRGQHGLRNRKGYTCNLYRR